MDWIRATPMWSSAFDPAVLKVMATPCERAAPLALDVERLSARVVTGDGSEHVLLCLDGPSIRFDVVTGTVLSGPVTLEPIIALGGGLDARLGAARRLDAMSGGVLPPLLPDPRLERLVHALRALDARREGVSLRELAPGIYGDCEWPGEGDCVKSRVRRLVALAETMRRAGPRGILNRTI